MIRVILFEDNADVRNIISLVLKEYNDISLTGTFEDANDVIARIHNHRPDVVLMDIQMPGRSGIDALKLIKSAFPQIKVLIHTVFEDNHRIFTSLCHGASGYLLKTGNTHELADAIRNVYAGGSMLSPSIATKVLDIFQSVFVQQQITYTELSIREKEVLQYMVKGMSRKMIADACAISQHTVHWHLKNIYEKLHVNSAPEAVAKAIESRLV